MFGGGLFDDLPPPSQSSSSVSQPQAQAAAPAPVVAAVARQSPSPALSAVAPAAAAAVAPVFSSSSAAEHGAGKPSSGPSITKMVPAVVAHTPPATVRKAPGILAAPPSVLRNQSASASKANLKVHATPRPQPAVVELRASPAPPTAAAPPPPTAAVQAQAALVAASASVVEEYDPSRPNDYEEYCRERKRKKMEEEMKQELVRRRQEDEEKERERERQRELERQKELEREATMTGEEAWKRRGMLSNNRAAAAAGAATAATRTSAFSSEAPAPPRSPSPPPPPRLGEQQQTPSSTSSKSSSGGGAQMTAAQRMMARMGWKEGQGLGKQEQGITTPLMAKKTDKRAGVIVNASQPKKQKAAATATAVAPPASSNAAPTRVVLLRNMVAPGEVDSELEEEVASECSKYGVVTRVLIYEIIEQDFPQTEAVRIFIQFERSEQAGKALADLDGRFFGGRVVKASFFDEDRFAKNQLAPVPGEVPVAP